MAIVRIGVRVCGLQPVKAGSALAAQDASVREHYSHQFLVLAQQSMCVGALAQHVERQFERLYGARIVVERVRDAAHFDLDAEYLLAHVFDAEHQQPVVVAVCREDDSRPLITPSVTPVGALGKRPLESDAETCAPPAKVPAIARSEPLSVHAPVPLLSDLSRIDASPVPKALKVEESKSSLADSETFSEEETESSEEETESSEEESETSSEEESESSSEEESESSSEESEDETAAKTAAVIRPVPLRPVAVQPVLARVVTSAVDSSSESEDSDEGTVSLTGLNDELKRSASVLSTISAASQDVPAAPQPVKPAMPPASHILAPPKPGGAPQRPQQAGTFKPPVLTFNAPSRRKARRQQNPKASSPRKPETAI